MVSRIYIVAYAYMLCQHFFFHMLLRSMTSMINYSVTVYYCLLNVRIDGCLAEDLNENAYLAVFPRVTPKLTSHLTPSLKMNSDFIYVCMLIKASQCGYVVSTLASRQGDPGSNPRAARKSCEVYPGLGILQPQWNPYPTLTPPSC